MGIRPRILALFGSAILFGQERGNIEALAALRERGCEILCLVRNDSWNKQIPATLEARGLAWRRAAFLEQRLPGRLRWFLLRNPIAFIAGNWQFLEAVRQFRPTHIHAFNPLYVLTFLPGLLFVRTPMVYRAGDKPTLHRWFWRLVWRFVIWRTRRFVANSRFVARELTISGVPPHRIELIYSAPPRHESFGSFRLPDGFDQSGLFYFVYIGQITADKGVDVLVEAFRRITAEFTQARLLIAGRISDWPGDAWGRKLRDTVISSTDLRQRVAFLDYVEDVPGLLAVCDVHVCPSVWDEPFANVVIEAKAAGRPSIVFPSGGLREVLVHDVEGCLCPDKTVDALAEAMCRYIKDPGTAKSHGLAAQASLVRFGVPQFARAWYSIYQAEL